MLITFYVTQEDIDKAGDYRNIRNCLGCTVLKRILKVGGIRFGGWTFDIKSITYDIEIGDKFKYYLRSYGNGEAKPETHSVDIPKSVLEQIGYFEQKGTTHVDDYMSKENDEPRKIPSQTSEKRYQVAEK